MVAALGIAASPFGIIPAILLLLTDRPKATAGAFSLAWFAGIATVTTIAVLLTDLIEVFEETPSWVSWARVALGAVLVVVGAMKWLRPASDAGPPSWMSSLETATPASAFRLGLLISAANPKVLLLALAGGLSIGDAVTGGSATAVAVVAFSLLAAAAVLAPLTLFTVVGTRILVPLGRAKDWLVAHNATVMAAVLVVIGLLLLVKGIRGL